MQEGLDVGRASMHDYTERVVAEGRLLKKPLLFFATEFCWYSPSSNLVMCSFERGDYPLWSSGGVAW